MDWGKNLIFDYTILTLFRSWWMPLFLVKVYYVFSLKYGSFLKYMDNWKSMGYNHLGVTGKHLHKQLFLFGIKLKDWKSGARNSGCFPRLQKDFRNLRYWTVTEFVSMWTITFINIKLFICNKVIFLIKKVSSEIKKSKNVKELKAMVLC